MSATRRLGVAPYYDDMKRRPSAPLRARAFSDERHASVRFQDSFGFHFPMIFGWALGLNWLLEPHFGLSRGKQVRFGTLDVARHTTVCMMPNCRQQITLVTGHTAVPAWDRQRKIRSGHQLQSNQMLQKRVCGAAGGWHLCSRVTALFPYNIPTQTF